VFCDTGVEYPEIVEFVKEFPKTVFLKPKMSFFEVLEKYGYPMVSKEVSQKIYEIRTTKSNKLYDKRMYGDDKGNGKLAEKWKFLVDLDVKISHKCCDVLKKRPAEQFEKDSGLAPYIGDMASESRLRETNWISNYCNSFNSKRPFSHPLSFWTERDVWEYIYSRDLKVSDIYQTEKRTGCMYCLFGCQFDDEDGAQRFDRMKETHPKYYAVAEKKGIIDMLDLIRPKG
jgi:3'-phosphoadenosine 5'-phosphosulfate sulfotransferase (PAPS reductase)/FAD synthetase